MNPHCHIINPLPVLLAIASAALITVPGIDAQTDEPSPESETEPSLLPVYIVAGITAAVAVGLSLYRARVGTVVAVVVLGLSMMGLAAWNGGTFGGTA